MLNVIRSNSKAKVIEVKPSDNLFKELGNNNYNFVELISELIDNSISAKIANQALDIIVDIAISKNDEYSYLIIKDNGKGIKTQDLGNAISPAGFSGGSTLNEHGLGMKQAIASLGELKYLISKTNNEKFANYLTQFKFGELKIQEVEVSGQSGTEICVENIKEIVPGSQQKITRSVVPYLSAKYRRFLTNENSKVKITINLYDADEVIDTKPKLVRTWDLEELKPVYFHPHYRNNKPLYIRKKFKGKGWEACFTIGYAPTKEEYFELGIDCPKDYEPYNVSINKQGFDLISHDRVINFTQFSELGFVKVRHHHYNYLRGEIDLIKGFKTSTTKNHVVRDKAFKELIEEIKSFMDTEKLFEKKSVNKELPELLLRDRLKSYLENRKIDPKKNIVIEYKIEGLGGSVDILADGEAWEMKRGQAAGLDVYQLFAYLDMGKVDKGYLVAKSFAPSAESASVYINKVHSKEIILVPLEEFPINDLSTTEEERLKYFNS